MTSSYSSRGCMWCCLSVLAAVACSVGFYMPYWLEGAMTDGSTGQTLRVYLSTFRRCNYPILDKDSGVVAVVRQCGRYTTFGDIPSWAWRVACVVCGVGSGLSMLACLVSLAGCCVSDLVTPAVAKTLGVTQLCACLAIGAGCVLYPHGLESKEAREVCGSAAASFHLGDCRLFWAYYVTVAGAALNFVCFCFSFVASDGKKHYRSVHRNVRF